MKYEFTLGCVFWNASFGMRLSLGSTGKPRSDAAKIKRLDNFPWAYVTTKILQESGDSVHPLSLQKCPNLIGGLRLIGKDQQSECSSSTSPR